MHQRFTSNRIAERCFLIVALGLLYGCIDPKKETECLSDNDCASSGKLCVYGTCEGNGESSDSDLDVDSDTDNDLPGCNGNAAPPTSPSGEYLTVDVSGTSREYVLELPTAYNGRTLVPVIFAVHGMGATAQDFLGPGYGDVRNGIAGRALIVGPQGLSRNGQTGWAGDGGIEQVDIDFFDALVVELNAEYCIDSARIFAMGHGDGALFTNELGCRRSDIVRGIGPVAGWGPQGNCGGKVAAMIAHNPYDTLVVWSTFGWPALQFWLEKNECGDPGTMPTGAFPGDSTTGDPLPCQAMGGCDAAYPVTLCLFDYSDQWDGADAFPVQWGGEAVTDFFLALPKVK